VPKRDKTLNALFTYPYATKGVFENVPIWQKCQLVQPEIV